jgi:hypothetical protein
MERILNVYVNRVTIQLFLGIMCFALMLLCSPYVNVFLCICGIILFVGGCTFCEEHKAKAGERLINYKLNKIVNNIFFE